MGIPFVTFVFLGRPKISVTGMGMAKGKWIKENGLWSTIDVRVGKAGPLMRLHGQD